MQKRVTPKSLTIYFIKTFFAGALIYYMVQKGNLDFEKLYKNIPLASLFLGIALLFLTVFINNFRWSLLLKSQGLSSGVLETLKISFIGLFFNFIFPSAIGGDVMRSFYIAKDNHKEKVKAVFSVVVDRILGMSSMLTLALVTMLFYMEFVLSTPELRHIFISLIFITIFFISFVSLSLSKRLREVLSGISFFRKIPLIDKVIPFYNAVHAYGHQKGTLLISYFLSIISQVGMICFIYLVGQYLGGEALSLSTYFFAVPIGLIIIALPISPAGIGVGQLAFAYLFRVFSGVETDVGQLGITAYQMVFVIWGLVGAIFYVQRKEPQTSSHTPSHMESSKV